MLMSLSLNRMKMYSSFVLLVAAFYVITDCSARDWKSSSKRRVRWDNNCDFPVQTMAVKPASTVEQCSAACIANRRCTYFTHLKTTCYLKNFEGDLSASQHSCATCGYVPNRLQTNLLSPNANLILF